MRVNPERLRRVRKAAGLSPKQLAAAMGCSHMLIWRAERGDTTPRPDALYAWAKACGVSVDSLYTRAA